MDAPDAPSKARSRWAALVALGLVLCAGSLLVWRPQAASSGHPQVIKGPARSANPQASNPAAGPGLQLPSGAAPGMSCVEAQRVASFFRHELAVPAVPPLPRELAEAWASRADPHGLWSAAPDGPLATTLEHEASDMLQALQGQAEGCEAATRAARVFEAWLGELATAYVDAFESARTEQPSDLGALFTLVAEPVFEDDPVTRPARELSRLLGRQLGTFVARFPEQLPLAEAARARFLPQGEGPLSELLVLAALRAYVPLVDPHSDFAPLDEEWALYAGDSTLDGGSPLWGEVTRVPLGARVTDDPAPPLQLDDVVLAINGLWLAGASLDQMEQAARSVPDSGHFELLVLRRGEPELLHLELPDVAGPDAAEGALHVEHIAYGATRSVLVVSVPDVSDWLGDDFGALLAEEGAAADALLLDLRGNGGGSLDAAVDLLGHLLPGAPLFPLIRRGQVSEVLAAPSPDTRYQGPVATLVDADTASAAEMIAGALQAYERGPVLGVRTFGKGCVQEYFDDVSSTGVLRVTTLQFVLPSGSPLQQIGLTPELSLNLAPASEREATITRQPITFEGPDVRDRQVAPGPSWPKPNGPLGPCEDAVVCDALARLAGARWVPRAARPRAGTR